MQAAPDLAHFLRVPQDFPFRVGILFRRIRFRHFPGGIENLFADWVVIADGVDDFFQMPSQRLVLSVITGEHKSRKAHL